MLFPQNRCTISDEWTLNKMRVVWMENDLIKVGVLVGRGSDIFEFRYKPFDVNLLLRLPTDLVNPQQMVSQIRSTENQMEDYYYGGWQEALPNSAPFNYRGAQLGQHGEVWMIPWKKPPEFMVSASGRFFCASICPYYGLLSPPGWQLSSCTCYLILARSACCITRHLL